VLGSPTGFSTPWHEPLATSSIGPSEERDSISLEGVVKEFFGLNSLSSKVAMYSRPKADFL
jgi:hypothetical protein